MKGYKMYFKTLPLIAFMLVEPSDGKDNQGCLAA